ncbi:hypothetical protein HIM_05266 [Hirsutella minnesotensis 3608]|uniref:FAD-binding domain-containing protein n=1 Tax=Hirsutella minnesotensis 3608 TaxID=1043627 RepID=A0A0F7ZPE1_9HYPO|nr:hypothetical protein HIM_05266 [Hirsutella minnesotensis 3608]
MITELEARIRQLNEALSTRDNPVPENHDKPDEGNIVREASDRLLAFIDARLPLFQQQEVIAEYVRGPGALWPLVKLPSDDVQKLRRTYPVLYVTVITFCPTSTGPSLNNQDESRDEIVLHAMHTLEARILGDGKQNVEMIKSLLVAAFWFRQARGRKHVRVDIVDEAAGTTKTEEYDIVVACDGLRSRTRDMILFTDLSRACVKSVNVFVAFFELPAEPQVASYARLYNLPGRRSAFIKPIDTEISSAYLGVAKFDQSLHEARESRNVDGLAKAASEANNFYFVEISQVKLKKWFNGRCVLLGDTALCPAVPIDGTG